MVRANFCQILWGSHIGGQIIWFVQNLRLKYWWISFRIYPDLQFTWSWTFAARVTFWKILPDPSCRKVGTFGLGENFLKDWLIWVHTRTCQKYLIFCVRVPFRCKKLFPRILISQLCLLQSCTAVICLKIWVHTRNCQKCLIFCARVPFMWKNIFSLEF